MLVGYARCSIGEALAACRSVDKKVVTHARVQPLLPEVWQV
jgi:hypothetical protein